MSLEAKQVMLKDFEESLSDKLSAAYTAAVIEVIADKMDGYEVEVSATDDGCDPDGFALVAQFIAAKRVEGKSEKTLESYSYSLERMLKAVGVGPKWVTTSIVREYLASLKIHGNSDRTLENNRSVLCSFFGWLVNEGLIRDNPMRNISPISYERKVRRPLSDVDLYRISEECDVERGSRCTADRNKAIIAFLESTGCRISEMCGLNRDSIDFDAMEVKVLGKGNKERIVYINDVAAMLIKRYLEARTDNCEALFIGKRSDRLTPGGVRYMLNLIASRAGVENVHPHRFRRTLATNLIGHGMPIQEVSKILGHDSLDTTMTYIYIGNATIKSSYQKYL